MPYTHTHSVYTYREYILTDVFSQVEDPLNRRAASPLYLPDVIFGKPGVEGNRDPRFLARSLLLRVAKEGEEPSCALVSLFGGIYIESLDAISSFPSSFLKGILIIASCFIKLIENALTLPPNYK